MPQRQEGMSDEDYRAGLEALRRDWGSLSVDPNILGILRAASDPTTGLLVGMRAPIIAEIINRALATRSEDVEREGFAPCPTCKQYSHSIGDDQLAEAFNHFQGDVLASRRRHPDAALL